MASEINAILKKYLAAMGKNESGIAELSSNLRGWAVENGEIVKEKIEKQIDETAIRMGFVKASDLDVLLARISDLEERIPTSKDVNVKKSKAKAKTKANEEIKDGKRSEKKSVTSKKEGK